jgi:2-oxoisovalerate dehydrogenase E1 component beta subunit
MDQIINEAARLRYRSNGTQGCPMVIRTPYGGGIRGGLYHSQCLEAFFCHVPGLKVVAPATPYDVAGLLRASLQEPDPVLFFEHKKTYRLIKGEVPDERFTVPIGKAAVRREGRDLTVVTYGLAMHYALEAAERVAKDGIQAEVIDLRTLKPLDEAAILESVRKTSKVLVAHEDSLTGGWGAEIAALISEKAFEHLDGPVTRLAAPDVPLMPFNRRMEDFLMIDPDKIERAIRSLAAY